MEPEKYTLFYKGTFSQWHPSHLKVDNLHFNCAEQYMMWRKAELFKDHERADMILVTDSPREQKLFGRHIENFDADLWNQCCREIVYKGNMAKFTQNGKMLEELVATKGTILVEASPKDVLWGIGLAIDNPLALDKKEWLGKNWLGYALTAVRDEIIKVYGL